MSDDFFYSEQPDQMKRADALRQHLETNSHVDRCAMQDYSEWLVENGFSAETSGGWPSNDAYRQENIIAYISQRAAERWDRTEESGEGLGEEAPFVFAHMIGRVGVRKDDNK